MINISMILNHVKARLGVTHRRIEFSDEALIQCLTEETLKTLSVYHPYYCTIFLNPRVSQVMPGSNTYYVPTELGESFELMSVDYIVPGNGRLFNEETNNQINQQGSNQTQTTTTSYSFSGPYGSGNFSGGGGFSGGFGLGNAYSFFPAGSNLQSTIVSLANMKLGNTIAGASQNPFTFDFLPPNMIRLNSPIGGASLILVARTTHKKDFTTFPFGMLETIKELALYDVIIDIFSIRKYFANVRTLFAEINLDMDMYNDAISKRTELIERIRKNQLKYSHTKKIYIH